MKYYYLNKIAMAVLVALLLFFGTRTLIDIIYEEHPPEKPGYEVAGAEGETHGKKEKAVDENAAFIAALNKADPATASRRAARR
jgi:cytochrome c